MGNTPAFRQPDAEPSAASTSDWETTALLMEQKRSLEQINSWFEVALNNMVRGLSMFDANQRLVVSNKSYREIYSLPQELTQPGTHLGDIVRYHVRSETGRENFNETASFSRWLAQHMEMIAEGRSFTKVQQLRNGRTLLVTYQPLAEGGWVDIQEDITEKRRTEERIEWLAHHDALTGVANRFHFRQTFEAALADLGGDENLALHWLDLDEFKEVNDTHGHPIGDALLKAVAQRLRASIRKSDFLARLGGDEFAIIQRGDVNCDQCERLAERILTAINRPFSILGHAISVSASIGIVRAPAHGNSPDELLKNADVALYNVKSAGRCGYELYQRGCGRHIEAQRRLEVDIQGALDNKQFELHYQPILNLKSNSVTGCEALLRWQHPDDGLVTAGTFMPLAEKTGAIVDIGKWVLQQACRDAMRWSDDLSVTVNVSMLEFDSGTLTSTVQQALASSGLAAERLELEVGETLLARDKGNLRATLAELKQLGVTIALDSFGKDAGALTALRAFPFNKVKIDGDLVRDAALNRDNVAIIRAVAMLAETLGMGAVAKGVETLDELDAVTRAGCGKAQGYFIGRPVPIEQLDAMLSECTLRRPCAA
ncbi:EAL domain-containing protein [Hyphomicrobium sulfonivorans]|uniref:EAL domain-containing protein n=1 Tax=Hyphomicrobium sulfonivorans TaxID=121290 RepID=UPI00156F3764|nr:EAL domain-containing protein [Hyphomicrobium sulfonivorans]MBI1648568.1 EAL domain-containing protein [Hyphomicrobium sulfonivorans]NSL70894.1 GGDEF-domain containing protein [Hyphomicrobium sulfonivorans]